MQKQNNNKPDRSVEVCSMSVRMATNKCVGDVETVKVETTWSKKGLKRSEKVKRRVQKIPETGRKGPKNPKKVREHIFQKNTHSIRYGLKQKKYSLLPHPPFTAPLYSKF